jgi:hypothetical protein
MIQLPVSPALMKPVYLSLQVATEKQTFFHQLDPFQYQTAYYSTSIAADPD